MQKQRCCTKITKHTHNECKTVVSITLENFSFHTKKSENKNGLTIQLNVPYSVHQLPTATHSSTSKLSAHLYETEKNSLKHFWNCFKTVLKLFWFIFISMCGEFRRGTASPNAITQSWKLHAEKKSETSWLLLSPVPVPTTTQLNVKQQIIKQTQNKAHDCPVTITNKKFIWCWKEFIRANDD